MSKAYLGAFVAIAAIAVGAVDYINQAKAAGSTPGRFGIGAYGATISGRFIGQKQVMAAAAERQELLAMTPRDLLPEPPEGWSRHDWDDATADLFGRGYDMQKDASVPDEIKEDPTMKALTAMDRAAAASKDAREVFVYEKPGTVIAMRLHRAQPGGDGGLAGAAMKMVANNMEAMSGKAGYAVIKGVTFREEYGILGAGADQRGYRVITGQIGTEVKLSLRARAEDADIVALLNAIDYDRLNRMLETPVAGIGSAAEDVPADQQRAEADRRVQDAAATQRTEAAEADYRMQAAALDFSHRMGAVNTADYEKAKAKLAQRRAQLDRRTEAPAPGAETRTAALADAVAMPTDPASVGGGLVGSILGAIGFGGGTPVLTEDAPITPANAKPAVKVNTLGAGSCIQTGIGKRCKIGG